MYNGQFFPTVGDLAIMLPMLEMTGRVHRQGKIHSRYIKDTLYLYRVDNPISDIATRRAQQVFLAKVIRARTPYEPLAQLAG